MPGGPVAVEGLAEQALSGLGFSSTEATGDFDRFTASVNSSEGSQRGNNEQRGLRSQGKLLEGGGISAKP